MVIWKEREHEIDDVQAAKDPVTVRHVRECGLLKYFRVLGMKEIYVRLLEHIIQIWDHYQLKFVVGTHTLSIYMDDIYFLTRLSHRGRPIVLSIPLLKYCNIEEYSICIFCGP